MDEFYTIFEIDKFVKSVYSTVTDFPMSTPTDNLIPYITFIYRFKINKKGKMMGGKYSDFGMGFYESY